LIDDFLSLISHTSTSLSDRVVYFPTDGKPKGRLVKFSVQRKTISRSLSEVEVWEIKDEKLWN